jgi:hypothetical protein
MLNTTDSWESLVAPMSAREYNDKYWPRPKDLHTDDEWEATIKSSTALAAKAAREMGVQADASGRYPWAVWAVIDARDQGFIQSAA